MANNTYLPENPNQRITKNQWKKRYRHREGSNQEPYALKAYALTARIKPGTAFSTDTIFTQIP